MAADTAQRRFSAMNIGSPWRGLMVVPSGTVGAEQRASAMFLYSGISIGTVLQRYHVGVGRYTARYEGAGRYTARLEGAGRYTARHEGAAKLDTES